MLRRRRITPIVLPLSADDLLPVQESAQFATPIPYPVIAPAPADIREILQFFRKVEPPLKCPLPQAATSEDISKGLGSLRCRGESRPQPVPSVIDSKALQDALSDFRRPKKQKE